ncbi:hypothetical protein PV326_007382 [Microctonus aethiopoides]|nr:hypothetical protein PV326_007382 [Microctonus aethiopoides]
MLSVLQRKKLRKSKKLEGDIFPLDEEFVGKLFKPDINDIVNVRWDNSKHQAKILRISTTRKYLETIFVSADRDVVPSTKNGKHKFTILAAEERKALAGEKKKSNAAQKNTEKTNNAKLLNARRVEDEANAQLLNGQNHNESNNETDKKSNNEKCTVCASFPTVTAEMILSLELIVNHLKARHEHSKEQSKIYSKGSIINESIVSHDESQNNDVICLPHWKIPEFGKIELIPSSGVWLKQSDVDFALYSSASDNPNEVIRKLLKLALGEANVYKYCALGTSTQGKLGIPPSLKNAVHRFVEIKFPEKKVKNYNRVINLMCAQSVHPSKKRKNQSCTIVSSQLDNPTKRHHCDDVSTCESEMAINDPNNNYPYSMQSQQQLQQPFSIESTEKFMMGHHEPQKISSNKHDVYYEPNIHQYSCQQSINYAPPYQSL